jgi:soluble lytic murein transglycosylase
MRFTSFLRLAGLTLPFLLSCKTQTLRSIASAKTEKWIADYNHARELSAGVGATANASNTKSKQQACEIFQSLAKADEFPAPQLAELRALEVCPTGTVQANQSNPPEWLKEISLDVQLNLVQQSENKALELDLAAEKSRQRLPQNEKIKWIQLSLKRAEELRAEDKIKDLKRRLYLVAPRFNPEPKEKDWLAVAADYRMARQFSKAHEYYDKVIASKDSNFDDKLSAYKGKRLAYKNARKNEAHLEACAELIKFLQAQVKANPSNVQLKSALYDANIFHARALWTQGRAGDARTLFTSTEKRLRGRVSLAELYWLQARMAEEDNDFAAVTKFLDLALKERLKDSALRDKIIWYSAWNERRQAHFEAAAERFADLDAKTQDEFLRLRALFWRGKSLMDAKKEDDAKALFERVATLDPLGYYGLLSRRQLGYAIVLATQTESAAAPSEASSPLPLNLNLADFLVAVNEREALTAVLDQASGAYRKAREQSNENWTTIFKYYARAGLYMKLFESLSSLAPDRRKAVLESHPELLFPQPWSDEVRTASLQSGVQEELIYAIIRQESAFDPRARSGADAFGLMQLLPEVAENLSKGAQVPYAQMDDLYEPRTNINLGAAHLKELLARNKGQFILAVASYNANENAIRNWMKTRYRGDALEFIEEIPYEETRTYVRLVMRNLIFYSLLRSKNASIEFPGWLLKLDAT